MLCREDLCLPDRTVEGGDSEDIPFTRDPAPKSGISIHVPLRLCSDKEVRECRDKWQAVAAQEIVLLEASKLVCAKLVVEGKENIQGHGKGPVSISRHEP
jgi:hypothetical protein